MKIISEHEIRATVSCQPSTKGIDYSLLDDRHSGSALHAFLTLTQFAEHFLRNGWSAESLFWSRYYWFRCFVARQAKSHGKNTGLEQQAIEILEHPYPACSPDWSELEAVEQRVHEE